MFDTIVEQPDTAAPNTNAATTPSLRLYQLDVVTEIERAIEAGRHRISLVAPTGSGKTAIAAEIIKRAVERHRHVLIVAHRREIITQTGDKLATHGVLHGIIMAGVDPRPMASVLE